ncbi:hypothetical protein JNW90_09080 [Micromonospora sp. STR1s_5]|nr:hypothetical protein [Micromonospora sp. STR1s_5]
MTNTHDRIPLTRPVPTTADRIREAALAGGTRALDLEGDLAQVTRQRDEALEARDVLRQQLNAVTITNNEAHAELTAAWAAINAAGRPGPHSIAEHIRRMADERVEPHEDPARLRQQLAEAHADCARYATERDEARAALADPLRTAAKDLRLLADQHSIDSLGFGIGWAADRLDDWASTPDEAAQAPPGSPSPRAQDAELPAWVLDLVRGLDRYEVEHPKLFRYIRPGVYEPWDCPAPLLALVPSEVRRLVELPAQVGSRETEADPACAAQARRDRVEHAIRARLGKALLGYHPQHLDQVAAVAAVAAVQALTGQEG